MTLDLDPWKSCHPWFIKKIWAKISNMKKIILMICLSVFTWLYAQETTRFIVVGDPHNYSPSPNFKETIFFEIVLAAIDEQVDFIFLPGDLAIVSFSEVMPIDSVLKDWRFVLDTLNTHDIRVYACRGNNDYSKETWDSLFTGEYLLPQNGPEDEKNITYAVDYNNILLVALDQYTLSHRINQSWLDSILTNNQKIHVFAAGHEPAFKYLHTNCMGAYPEERNIFWESLITAKTKIYFCAHDHFYNHALINDGDGNPNNDIHQVIVGTASSLHQDGSFNGDNGRWVPDSVYHEKKNGYVLVEVEDENVQFTWKHRVEPHVFDYGGDAYQFLTTSIEDHQQPVSFQLYQNFPNPFNPKTTIKYEISMTSEVELNIYNILGEKVATLESGKQTAGNFQVEWDAADFASGIYFYTLVINNYMQSRKMILLK